MLTQANALRIPLADESVSCVVTSPPYWGLRKYSGDMAQIWGGAPDCAHEWGDEDRQSSGHRIQKNMNALRAAGRNHDNPFPISTTLGWQPTCDHDHEPVPATVFDPFAGSGTTLQVARALGRNGVGLDLSLEYLHLARQRLSLDALEAWGKAKKDGSAVTDLPMFEELI